ncbi:MAG: SCO1664 family protein [Nitriliruptorales bacterium]|nr:SCO1664 family protein [Nitriliruptorales bacterium]
MTADRPDDLAGRLGTAPLDVIGQYASASNVTLLCHIGPIPEDLADAHDPSVFAPRDLAVYKPQAGEAPLWDFPTATLYRREVAAYELDRLLGWGFVPVTVVREDGPMGRGAVQRYVPHDPNRHYFWMLEQDDDALTAQLQRMVVFDILIDNADRKGGHVLLEDDRVRLVDHGVSFHVERKLRTVAWHFAGMPVPEEARREASELSTRLRARAEDTERLRRLLSEREYQRLVERVEEVVELERFPDPTGPRPYPWPLL